MGRLPDYLIKKVPKKKNIDYIRSLLSDRSINSVCESAKCPNIGECFSSKTMTFMILGDVCARRCSFCGVGGGIPSAVDPDEPQKILEASNKLGLNYVVITSVTRDDLDDGGAEQFCRVIRALSDKKVEVLIPDFNGNWEALRKVVAANPCVINHNVETVPRLYEKVRPQAVFERSLELLFKVKSYNSRICTKSGFMVGLGESDGEVFQLLDELKKVNCDIVTIGQYLAPSKGHPEVERFVNPVIFDGFKRYGEKIGLGHVEAGPFVRSSFNAEEIWKSRNV